jgi:RHS repeat-associated protein
LPDNAYRYNGKELDEATGLYDYGARYYDPAVARWGQVDPLAEVMPEWSPYNYTYGNPISFNDPTGMIPCPNCWAAAAGMLWEYGTQVVGNRSNGDSWADAAWNNIDGGDIAVEGLSFFVPGGKLAKTAGVVATEFTKVAIDVQMDGDISYIGDGTDGKDPSAVLESTVTNTAISLTGGAIGNRLTSKFTDEAVSAAESGVTAAQKNLRKARNVEAAGGAGSPGARSYDGPTVLKAEENLWRAEDIINYRYFGNFFGLGTSAGREVVNKTAESAVNTAVTTATTGN